MGLPRQGHDRSTWTSLYLLSGAAGIIYEVAWSRLFTLHLGGLVPALTALLAAYLGGMALGSALGGRWAQRPGRPLRRFALLEVGTAALALAVLPGLELLDPWFRRLYTVHLETGVSFVAPAGATAALLVIPAAVLMGATLPTLVGLAGGDPANASAAAGGLYAANTLGAVSGALATGLALLPRLGLQGTLAVAAVTNVLVAAAALALDLRSATGFRAAPPSAPALRRPGVLVAAVVLAGTASMVLQIGWTRALALSIGSSTYAFTVTLAAFLLGLGLGGFAGARWTRRALSPAIWLAALQGGAAVASLISLYVLGRLPLWIVAPLARSHASLAAMWSIYGTVTFLVVLVPTFLLGAAFPLAVRMRGESGSKPGRATGDIYAAGSMGLVAGALIAGGLLLPGLGLRRSLLTAALTLTAASLLAAAAASSPERRGAARTALTLAGLGICRHHQWTVPLRTPVPCDCTDLRARGRHPSPRGAGDVPRGGRGDGDRASNARGDPVPSDQRQDRRLHRGRYGHPAPRRPSSWAARPARCRQGTGGRARHRRLPGRTGAIPLPSA